MKSTATLLFILTTFLAGLMPGYAADMDMSNMDMAPAAHAAGTEAVGVVDEINSAKNIVTISHEAIKSLDWPAMTMNFTAADKKLLGKLAKGKKIHFTFVQQKGKYVITEIK